MATVSKELVIDAPPEQVWDAVRDVGAVHRRLVRGLVVDTTLDGDVSLQVFAEADGRTRLVWITDALPHEAAGPVSALVEQGARIMRETQARASR